MAEAARRGGYGQGSEVVRRLISRPIRMQSTRIAMPVAVQTRAVETRQPSASESTEATAWAADADLADATPVSTADRQRTEMLLLKAVLQAERRENASLRACLGFEEAEETLTADMRAMRDRWAALVDRLLHAPV